MTGHIINSFRAAIMDTCAECDMGILDFAAKYKRKGSELFDLCVRHKLELESIDFEECGKPATLNFNKKFWLR